MSHGAPRWDGARPIEFLLVQDDPVDEMLLRDDFEAHKVVNMVHCVHDVPTAIAFLNGNAPFARPHLPDVVLLDLHLPGHGGHAVLQQLRSTPATADVPVILLVDSLAAELILRSRGLPVQGYATRPVDFACLVGVVKSLPDIEFEISRRR